MRLLGAAFLWICFLSPVASAQNVIQWVDAWQNEIALPSSTGQVTDSATCNQVIADNLAGAPALGYSVTLDVLGRGVIADPVTGISFRQDCKPADGLAANPVHPFAGPPPQATAVSCPPIGEGTDIWAVWGQSNAGNYGSGRYTASGLVYAYAGNGACYPLADPIAGAEGTDAGPWARLADKMMGKTALNGSVINRIVVANFAVGGSSINDWAPGGNLNATLIARLNDLIAHGMSPTRMLFHQGEADAGGMTASAWTNQFFAMLNSARVADPNHVIYVPIYVATATICNYRDAAEPSPPAVVSRTADWYITKEKNRLAIRGAQANVVNGYGVRSGPNTDLINPWKRADGDGCHLGSNGLDDHASMWAAALAH